MIRILVVDDHEVVRKGVKTLLAGVAGWEVCGEACDGQQAVANAAELEPDVIVLDVSMPNLGGIEAVRLIRQTLPAARIVLLSMHDPAQIRLSAGALADACVSKCSVASELTKAIAGLVDERNAAD